MSQLEMNFEISLTEQMGFKPVVAQRKGRKELSYNKRYAANTKISEYEDKLTSFNNVEMTKGTFLDLASTDELASLEQMKRLQGTVNAIDTLTSNLKNEMAGMRKRKG